MLAGMFATELATAFITPMQPFMMIAPTAGYPYPLVATIPIAWSIRIKPPVAHLDIQTNSHCAWLDEQTNRQKTHRKNRQFRFHSINCSHVGAFLDASRQS